MFFFFNDTATTEIYTLSLHDALPICTVTGPELDALSDAELDGRLAGVSIFARVTPARRPSSSRSEEHTSELQSRPHLVCRLLLEKKKQKPRHQTSSATELLLRPRTTR